MITLFLGWLLASFFFAWRSLFWLGRCGAATIGGPLSRGSEEAAERPLWPALPPPCITGVKKYGLVEAISRLAFSCKK